MSLEYPKVEYISDGSKELYSYKEAISENEEIITVKVTYKCPYCDTGNVEIHTPPIPRGKPCECSKCAKNFSIDALPSVNLREQYDEEEIEEKSKSIEKRRQVRKFGQEKRDDAKEYQKGKTKFNVLVFASIFLFFTGLFGISTLQHLGLIILQTAIPQGFAVLPMFGASPLFVLIFLSSFGVLYYARKYRKRVVKKLQASTRPELNASEVRRHREFLQYGLCNDNVVVDDESEGEFNTEKKKANEELVKESG